VAQFLVKLRTVKIEELFFNSDKLHFYTFKKFQ